MGKTRQRFTRLSVEEVTKRKEEKWLLEIKSKKLLTYCSENKYDCKNGFYSYQDYLDSIKAVYRLAGGLNLSLDFLIQYEQQCRRKTTLEDYEVYDEILLRSLKHDFPVFYIEKDSLDKQLLEYKSKNIDVASPVTSLDPSDGVLLFPKNNELKIKFCAFTSTYYGDIKSKKHDPNGVYRVSIDKKEREKGLDIDLLWTIFFESSSSITMRYAGRWGTDMRCSIGRSWFLEEDKREIKIFIVDKNGRERPLYNSPSRKREVISELSESFSFPLLIVQLLKLSEQKESNAFSGSGDDR